MPLEGQDEEARKQFMSEIALELRPAWERAVKAQGLLDGLNDRRLKAFRQRGLDLTRGEKAAQYFVKWGLAEELGLSPVKTRNQFTLLDHPKNPQCRRLFVEFVEAAKGMAVVTGVAKVKKYLEVSDEDVAAHVEELKEKREKQEEIDGVERVPVQTISLVIPHENLSDAISVGWYEVIATAESAVENGEDPQARVYELLLKARRERLRKAAKKLGARWACDVLHE